MIPAVGYIRVSSEQQAGEKQSSLADQREAIHALAQRLHATLGAVYEDAGISGATVAKRPALRALLEDCAANPQRPAGYVLVLNDSRFGRFDDPDEAAALRFQLKQSGWVVRFAEADESNDPTARHVMRAIGSAQASEYRRNLRANATRGRIGTVKQGYWASRAPFGYRRAVVFPPAQARVLDHGVCKAREEKIKLVPGPPEEVAMVQECFRRYASGEYSMRALCRWLNLQPVAREGRSKWFGVTVHNLLENYAYLGAIAARRRTAVRMEAGDYARQDPEFIVWDAHEPLIDRETFDRVQTQLRAVPPRGHAADYRVRGLVRCETCGDVFMGGGLGKRLKSTGEHARFYVCQGGREKRCPPKAPCITIHVLETAVINEVAAHIKKELSPAQLRKAFAARLQSPTTAKVDTRTAHRKALARKSRLISAIEAGALSIDEAASRLDAIRQEIAVLETEQKAAPQSADLQTQLDRLVARGRDVLSLAQAATGPELRALLRPWVDTMSFNKTSRTLTLRLRTVAHGLLAQHLPAAGSP